ncbi:ABC transporter permease [Natrarchaeobius halalkaliphilus]|uniref:ABC transporter permease n=1 Tax=Natrarchaeobius halalkaliphilus TaxID=1679091 RepID=A0A3N6MSR3_9EURY|nr:ABC transporter permease [Natrarchaeobius halalkaliphilus]RQG87795.1 ABC transporter permease [Natrarchaeobius halalkaliphilus]
MSREHTDTNDTTSDTGTPVADGSGAPANPLDVLETESDVDTSFGTTQKMKKYLRIYLWEPWQVMRRDWRALVGISILSSYIIIGILGWLFLEPTRMGDGPNQLPWFRSLAHPLGTNLYGVDLMRETIHAIPMILKMMFAGGVFTIIMGTVIGTVAGYKGGTVDKVLSTITDVFINIPGLPLVIVLAVVFTPESAYALGILLTIEYWAGLARAVRSQVLQIRYDEYTEASRTIGLPTGTILLKDVIPHLAPYITIRFVSAMRTVLFSAVGLYFIGVLPEGDTNWGIMLSNAYNNGAMYRPQLLHWILIPSIAIVALSIGMILLSQSLDRVFNPRVREKHKKDDEELLEEEEDVGGKGLTLG